MAINLFGRAGGRFGVGDEAIDDDAGQLDIPIHAFDLIIADECHRGYTREGAVGLARHARPLRRDQDRPDRHAGGPHHGVLRRTSSTATTTSGAVREGYLVDYDVVDDQVRRAHERRLPAGGRAGRAGRPRHRRRAARPARGRAALRRRPRSSATVTAPDSNRKILEEIKTLRRRARGSSTGRFPKTLIFAANDLPHTSHADQLVELPRGRVRPRRSLRCKDHRHGSIGRCSASASSATARTRRSSSPSTC